MEDFFLPFLPFPHFPSYRIFSFQIHLPCLIIFCFLPTPCTFLVVAPNSSLDIANRELQFAVRLPPFELAY